MITRPDAPDYGHGYLRVPLSVWAALYCRGPLTRRQLQLVSVVLRESWGWQTRGGGVHLWTRPLTTGHFARATGLATDHLARDLQLLVARGVLREKNRCYQLNASKPRVPVDNAGDKSGAGKAPAAESAEPAAETAANTARTALSPPGVRQRFLQFTRTSGQRSAVSSGGCRSRSSS
jgi:hypothetical protein